MRPDASTRRITDASPRNLALIGRDAEFAALDERLAAAAHGEGRVVLVGGEPGIGKSALLREFGRRAREGGWLLLTGRSYESEGMPPYLPFVEALRPHLAALDDEMLRARLAAGALELTLLMPELRARVPNTAIGEMSPEATRYRLFESVSEVLLRISETAECSGALLVLDDLHWADRPTTLLLLHLARKLPGRRLLVAGSYRTEEVDPGAPFFAALADLGRERLDARLVLAPLSATDTRCLVERLGVAGLSDAAIEEIHLQTRGNPFYIEEIVRQAQNEAGAPGGGDTRAWTIPEGIHQVIDRRLALLDPAVQRLLRAAAILGDGFQYEIAALLAGDPEPVVMDALEQAIHAGFLRERGEVCHFSHPLIQRTIYDGLTAARRRSLHLMAAETIEKTYARHLEPHLVAIAANYRLAGARADPDKTIDYLVRAGEAAERALAYEQAAASWKAALELMELHAVDLPQRAALLERLGDLMQIMGMETYREAASLFEQALKLYDEAGARVEAATVRARLGLLLAAGGPANDNAAALKHLRAAEEVLAGGPASEALLWLYSALGLVCVWQFRPEEGLAASRRAVELAAILGRHDRWVTNTVMCAYHLHHLGRLAEGFELLERASRRADEINLTYPAFVAASWLGSRLVDVLDPAAAMAVFGRESEQRRQLEAPDRRKGLLSGLAAGLGYRGELAQMRLLAGEHELASAEIATLEGRWENAEAALTRFHASALVREHSADLAIAGLGMARLRSARGDPSAVAVLSEVYSAALAGPATVVQMRSGPELAIQLALQGRVEEAAPVLRHCREVVDGGEDWRGRAGRVWLADAAVAYAGSRFEEGEERFERALEVFRRYALPWDEAEAYQVRGRLLASLGRRHRAAAAASFDQAREIYARIGAAPRWLEALEEAQGVALGRLAHARPGHPDGLSEREVEVLRLIAQGRSNREISEALVLSVRTVERHITNIYAKIGARGKADATAYALRHDLT